MKIWGALLAFLCAPLAFAAPNAAAVRCDYAVFVDKTNALSFAEVAGSREFRAIPGSGLTFGFSPFTHWLRVSCENPSATDFHGKYQFLYPVLNRLNVYAPGREGAIRLGFWDRAGSSRAFDAVLPELDLPIRAGSSSVFYVEANTTGTLQLQGRVVPDSILRSSDLVPAVFYGLLFGALLAMMLYNLFLGISLGEGTYLFYCGYVFSFILYQATVAGYGPAIFGSFGYSLAEYRVVYLHFVYFSITLFARSFLRLDDYFPRLSRLLLAAGLFYGLLGLLSPVLPEQLNFRFTAITSVVIPVALIWVAALSLRKGFRPAIFFISAWSLFLAAIVVTALRNIGLLPKIWIVDHILEFGVLTEVLLISLGLAFKMRVLERENERASREAADQRMKVLELNMALEKEKTLSAISAQVSHDIRSPLVALNMVTSQLKELPEEDRLIIRNATQRITDIANELLGRSRNYAGGRGPGRPFPGNRSQEEPLMLVSLIDDIISEKRVQFRDRAGIEIVGELGGGYNLFARISPADLARAVSNLINNSVEAIAGAGWVKVGVRLEGDEAVVTVSDNGKGIPPEILGRLGEPGVTFGKAGGQSGSGLGISHAKAAIERAAGRFRIESEPGRGTTVTLALPRASSPGWFPERISLPANRPLVTLDDDQTTHQIWSSRLQSLGAKGGAIPHLSFTSLEEFSRWAETKRESAGLFLVDYEFLGQQANGLDAIERARIADRAILVTSHFEEEGLRARAERLGVKILPKSLVPFVPLGLGKARVS